MWTVVACLAPGALQKDPHPPPPTPDPPMHLLKCPIATHTVLCRCRPPAHPGGLLGPWGPLGRPLLPAPEPPHHHANTHPTTHSCFCRCRSRPPAQPLRHEPPPPSPHHGPTKHAGAEADLPPALVACLAPKALQEDPGRAPAWRQWLGAWRAALRAEGVSCEERQRRQKAVSPKYVPRQHLLQVRVL